MWLGLKLIGVLTAVDFGDVGWLSDYRTSLSLKGKTTISHKKHTTIWRWFARKRYDYYSTTIGGLFVTIRYIGLSTASHLTTLRLFQDYFIGEITTIGYDYFRSCYDYSSRNATTIADLYWLSGESPKRNAAVAVNGSAPLAAPQLLDCPAGWSVPDCKPPGVWSIETPPGWPCTGGAPLYTLL